MIELLAFGFALGVLATVLAGEWERRKKRPRFGGVALSAGVIGYGNWTAGYLCNESNGSLTAAFGAQDSTAPGDK